VLSEIALEFVKQMTLKNGAVAATDDLYDQIMVTMVELNYSLSSNIRAIRLKKQD